MKRLRVPLASLREGTMYVQDAPMQYITRVHRLGVGAQLEVFDPHARAQAEAEIVSVHADRLELHVGALCTGSATAERTVRVVQALPKGDKLDAIVRDATELGASELWLCQSERAVVKLDAARFAHKRERLVRITEEAARQAGRVDVPTLLAPRTLQECVAADVAEVRLLLAPSATTKIAAPLRAYGREQSLSFYVGPEGGFSPAEIALAEAAGVTVVTLGPFVLRTETAVAAVLGALRLLDG